MDQAQPGQPGTNEHKRVLFFRNALKHAGLRLHTDEERQQAQGKNLLVASDLRYHQRGGLSKRFTSRYLRPDPAYASAHGSFVGACRPA